MTGLGRASAPTCAAMSVEVAIALNLPRDRRAPAPRASGAPCPAVMLLQGLDREGLLGPLEDSRRCGSGGGDRSEEGDLVLVGGPPYPCTVGARPAAPGGVHHQLHLPERISSTASTDVDGLARAQPRAQLADPTCVRGYLPHNCPHRDPGLLEVLPRSQR